MAESDSAAKRCAGTRKDGQSCNSGVQDTSGYCFAHDPQREADRAEARRRGGQNSANNMRLRGLVPPRLLATYDLLEQILGEVHTGELDPRVGTAMATIARAMVAVLTAGELEERMRVVEGRLNA